MHVVAPIAIIISESFRRLRVVWPSPFPISGRGVVDGAEGTVWYITVGVEVDQRSEFTGQVLIWDKLCWCQVVNNYH